MNASEAFKRPRLIRWLRRRTRSSGLARLDDRLREALESLLDVVAGLRGRVEDRAFVGAEDEARLADALLADEADFELEGLLLGLHGRLPHHGMRGTQPGGYQASGPIFSFRNGLARTLRCR